MMPLDYQDETPSPFREERLEEKKRRPAILIGVATGVVVAAFVGWATFGKYVSLYKDNGGELPLIKAEKSLYRIRPKTPGGMEVPNQDKLIYDRLRSSEGEPAVERLLPRPEKPAAPEQEVEDVLPDEIYQSGDPIGALAEHVSDPAELASGTVYDENGEPVEVMFRTVSATEGQSPAKTAAENPLPDSEPAKEIKEPVKRQTVNPAADKKKTETPSEGRKKVSESKQARESASKPAASAPAKDTGKFSVQLVSVRTKDVAEKEWKRLSSKYRDLVKGHPHAISEVTVRNNTYFRVRVGSFDTREQATDLCYRFKVRNQECIVAK